MGPSSTPVPPPIGSGVAVGVVEGVGVGSGVTDGDGDSDGCGDSEGVADGDALGDTEGEGLGLWQCGLLKSTARCGRHGNWNEWSELF